MADINEQRSVTTIFTNAGQKLAAQLIANKNTAKFTRGEISTTDLFNESVTDLQVLTSLDNVQQEATLAEVIIMDKSTVRVQLAVDQTKAPNDYQMRTVGLYAKPADSDEILYSVTVMKDPIYVHQDASGSSLGLNLDTIVGQSANVKIEVNPAGAVTNEALAVTLKDYVQTADLKKLLPDTLADTAKANAFTGPNSFAQAPTDGDGNPYITNKDAQAKVDAGVKTAASDAATKATAAQTAAEKHADDADKLLVKTADTTDWQKHSITAADGGNKYSFTTATTPDLVAAIQKMPLGYHTFYCQAGVNGNPSTQAIRGVAEITTAGSNPLGVGYVTDSTGAFWSYYIDNSGWKLKRSVDDSTAVHNGDQIGGRNLIVHTGELPNTFLDSEGKLSDNTTGTTNTMAGMIPVTAGEWLTFQQDMTSPDKTFRWNWYDSSKSFISRDYKEGTQVFNWQVPANTAYIRVSYPNHGSVKLERGLLASDWSDAPEELSGGRNYAIGAQKLTATDNGSGNDYPDGLLYKINPDVWGKNVTISFTATVSGFTGISDKHLASDPNPMISNVLSMDVKNDYDNRGIVLPTSDGTYTAVWHGNIGQMTGKNSQGHFKINMNAGAKVTIENLMIELGDVRHDYVPAPEDMASKTDVANYQHVKLTADDGSAEYFWRDPTLSLPNQILSLPLGMHTFFAVSGMKDAPALSTGGSFRGMVHISSSDLIGTGYMVDSVTGDMWSIAVANHAVAFEKLASDADTVKDNHNETVTVNGVSYTMVDKNNVLLINPATSEVTQVPKFTNGVVLGTHTLTITDADGLCIDGQPLDIVVADEATAQAKSAADHLHRYVTVEDDTGATS